MLAAPVRSICTEFQTLATSGDPFSMIFDKFSMGSSGVRSKGMDIYTFWIDLDAICSNLQEFGLVSRGSVAQIQKYGPRPKERRRETDDFLLLTIATVD